MSGSAGREAADALAALKRCRSVFFGGTSSVSLALLELIDLDRRAFGELEIVCGLLLERPPLLDHVGAPFHVVSLQPSLCIADDVAEGRVEYLPVTYSGVLGALSPSGPRAVDGVVVQVSPPDRDGRFYLGVSNGPLGPLIAAAPLVIAQVNRRVPRTYGSAIDRSSIDILFALDAELLEQPVRAGDAAVAAIGASIADLVPDGATIQTGIGGIPSEALGRLTGRSDLRVHSGVIGDSVMELATSGALRVGGNPPITTAEVLGTRALYDWVDGNSEVRLAPSTVSHRAPAGGADNFFAINGALEVALDGSVNSEWLAGRQISAAAGLPDFVQLGLTSQRGASVVALPSTGRGRSRIVPALSAGRTTIAPHHADVVMTEWGVALLRGRTVPERAVALRQIAHPDHRHALGVAAASASEARDGDAG